MVVQWGFGSKGPSKVLPRKSRDSKSVRPSFMNLLLSQLALPNVEKLGRRVVTVRDLRLSKSRSSFFLTHLAISAYYSSSEKLTTWLRQRSKPKMLTSGVASPAVKNPQRTRRTGSAGRNRQYLIPPARILLSPSMTIRTES